MWESLKLVFELCCSFLSLPGSIVSSKEVLNYDNADSYAIPQPQSEYFFLPIRNLRY